MSVEYTYNICGIYNANGEKESRKARIRFGSKTIATKYSTNVNILFDVCQSWLDRNYPGETLNAKEFDLDCEGKYETADNSDIIIAP